ncbi:diacylglycerol kinase [Rhodococcus ruber BKS 20-38]|uniref:Diacylglycerol kinase n=1 Tax=Rhodococcus ruber BKS 20-38 TaxID=1278076 RepID=M3A268_9NOCA|nr:diacylglycerol kinase [Rhodococcus ruber BKS 20-38]
MACPCGRGTRCGRAGDGWWRRLACSCGRRRREGSSLHLHSGRDAQPLRARPRSGPTRRAGRARRVQRRGRASNRLAEVNGHPFLNNVSLGIYGEAVRRAVYREAKMRTLLETAEKVLAPHGQVPPLHLVDDAGRKHRRPAVVLVSNNPYSLDRPPPGTRPTLDSGRLGIIVLDAPDHGPHPPGRAWSATNLDVLAPASVHAGLDGEAVDLGPLLHFTIRPKALRVRISSRHPGASPSATLQRVTPHLHNPRPPKP